MPLYYPNGQPIPETVAEAPAPGRWTAFLPGDAERDSEAGRALTPEKADAIMRAADSGDTARMCALAEAIDDRSFAIGAALDTRRAAVAATPWKLVPADESARAKGIAEEAEAMLRASDRAADLGLLTFQQMVQFELGSALLPGFAAPEIVWDKGGRAVLGYASVPAKHWMFRDGGQTPRLAADGHPDGIEVPPAKFCLHWHRAKGGSPTRGGLIRACAWLRCFEALGWKDLVRFAERHGMPFLVARVDENSWKTERSVLHAIVRNFGPDGGAVLSKNSEISLLEAGRSDGQIYFALMERIEQAAEKLILGQTGTSGEGGWSDNGAQHKVRMDIRDGDCSAIAATAKARILAPWTRMNHGPDAPVPSMEYKLEEARNPKERAEIVGILEGAGLSVDEEQVFEETGFRVERRAVAVALPPAGQDAGQAADSAPPAAGAESVQDTAFNGAQVTAAAQVVKDVHAGQMPRATGVAMLVQFVRMDNDAAERLMGETGRGFRPADAEALALDGEADGGGDAADRVAESAMPAASRAVGSMFRAIQERLDKLAGTADDAEFARGLAALSEELPGMLPEMDTEALEAVMAEVIHGGAAAGMAARAAEIKAREGRR